MKFSCQAFYCAYTQEGVIGHFVLLGLVPGVVVGGGVVEFVEACKTFPVLERKGGPPAFGWWGKVECGMSEYRSNGNMWHFSLCVKDKNAKAV